jgi:hypothetical protein
LRSSKGQSTIPQDHTFTCFTPPLIEAIARCVRHSPLFSHIFPSFLSLLSHLYFFSLFSSPHLLFPRQPNPKMLEAQISHKFHSNVHLKWDNALEPVLTVNSGDTVTFDLLDGGKSHSYLRLPSFPHPSITSLRQPFPQSSVIYILIRR